MAEAAGEMLPPPQRSLTAWGSSAWEGVVMTDEDVALLSQIGPNGATMPALQAGSVATAGSTVAASSIDPTAAPRAGPGHEPESQLQQLARSLSAHEAFAIVTRLRGRNSSSGDGTRRGQQQQQQQTRASRPPLPRLPSLDLSRVRGTTTSSSAGPVFGKNLPDEMPLVGPGAEEAALDASQRLFESVMAAPLHPAAPLVDNRCYVYKAVLPQELRDFEALARGLPPAASARVAAIWDALLTARRDCEAMAARGVRITRDVSRDWQETVSDLIDRVVAQDSEIAALKLQPGASTTTQPVNQQGSGTVDRAAQEELSAQAARLRRHRDRLARENKELTEALEAQRAAADRAVAEANAARAVASEATSRADMLWQRHQELLRHHIAAARYAEGLEAEMARRGGTAAQPQALAGAGSAPLLHGVSGALRGALSIGNQGGGSGGSSRGPGGLAAGVGVGAGIVVSGGVASGSTEMADSPRGDRDRSGRGGLAAVFGGVGSPRLVGSKLGAGAGRLRPSSAQGGRRSPAMPSHQQQVQQTPPMSGGTRPHDRRADQFDDSDRVGDDSQRGLGAPLPLGVFASPTGKLAAQRSFPNVSFSAAGAAAQRASGGSVQGAGGVEFDWQHDIELCTQMLEAFGPGGTRV